MIYEYAIDPEFIIKLADDRARALLVSQHMGAGKACVAAGYPKNMVQEVMLLLGEQKPQNGTREYAAWDEKVNRAVELAKCLINPATKRHFEQDWEGSFAYEHERHPLAGILSEKKASELTSITQNSHDLLHDNCSLYTCSNYLPTLRTGESLCEQLRPLLTNASHITFVDPYFFVEDRFIAPYTLFFKEILAVNHVRVKNKRKLTIITLDSSQVSGPKTKSIPHNEFEQSCRTILSPLVGNAAEVHMYRVSPKTDGQELHNRYILTEIGGVVFGHGTDITQGRISYDNISRLTESQLAHWMNAYKPNSDIFKWLQHIVIKS